ncbi:Phosphoglycerate kinase [Methyloligella halotolerans]|uniref:Phosphoglycerate kinase n=1 Tax=Methyloligella halotolerans TaxID=1177755 RepID=A0A1E2S3L8_9HYPH|nr:phosphoglycerate kinase [Methyloligella halotolerans]ODA68929.1 Phosphoglycerate kinase [Methyloligella halotolerans]
MTVDLSRIRSVQDVDAENKRVVLRADLNVPLMDGDVTDATRIERLVPTLELLQEKGAKIVLISHFGRPKGERIAEFSLKPVADALRTILPDAKIEFVQDCIGKVAHDAIAAMQPGDIVLLENLRYHPGEEANDEAFAEELASLGDLYVNDAFSAAHRAHASTDAIAKRLPAYAGLLMLEEIRALEKALEDPQRPVMAIVGGSKVSTKIAVLDNLAQKADVIVVGGGMANTFLFADGIDVGKSLCEEDATGLVQRIEGHANQSDCEIVLPTDAVTAKALESGVDTEKCSISDVPEDSMILDVGPDTVADLKRRMADVKTLLWNGPLGAFEIAPFEEGTFEVAREAARLTKEGKLVSVGGGGDTVAALKSAGVLNDFTYVSTAGGAFLEWLEGKQLPGIAALAAETHDTAETKS